MNELNLVKIELPQFLEKGLTPAAQEAGKTLGNIFYAVFSIINYPIEKLRVKHTENLKKYEQDIKYELSKIPEDQLVEPKLSIVGPALEASKYYIEDEELRKMFAKLIVSSMDAELTDLSHPSFIEIIKQLSSVEALIIKHLSEHSLLPYVELSFKSFGEDPMKLTSVEPYTKIEGLDIDYYVMASSLKNLDRLGLIKFTNVKIAGDDTAIENIIHDDIFDSYHEINNYMKENHLHLNTGNINIESGNIMLTTFGQRFSKICL